VDGNHIEAFASIGHDLLALGGTLDIPQAIPISGG
jgi:hypothetical protein